MGRIKLEGSITVQDIAKAAGVSPGTVSRALHDRDNVKDVTKRKVLEAVRRLNYDPVNNMPLVKKARARIVGLVVDDPGSDMMKRAFPAVKKTTGERGGNCMLLTQDDIDRMVLKEKSVRDLPCDGYIFCYPREGLEPALKQLRKWDFPCAVIGEDTKVPGVAALTCDNIAGTKTALQHLYDKGHRVIGLVSPRIDAGPDGFNTIHIDRQQAYEEFLKEKGLPFDPRICITLRGTREETDRLFSEQYPTVAEAQPTAFISTRDGSAASMIKRLRRDAGLNVPADVEVIGYGDDPIAGWYNPTITTVRIPLEEMAAMACELLLKHFAGTDMAGVTMTFPAHLVFRESCPEH